MFFGLNEPEKEEVTQKEIERAFNLTEDIEEIGKKLDKQNRKILTKEECDSLFIAESEILEDINQLNSSEKLDFKKRLKEIKEEALKEEILFSSEDFDIFGGITEDKTKLSTLGNVKHREIKKSKFRILEINKNTKNEKYIEILKDIEKNIHNALNRSKFGMKLNVFFASNNPLNNQKYSILYMNPQNAIDTLKEADKINLYNIRLKEKTNAIALTNIIYYDNANQTLPLGMNVSDKVIADISKLKLEPKKQKLFRINQEIDEMTVHTKIICVYEYEVMED